MRFVGRAFRGHDPRWSWSPLSGEGAALKGGRFNRIGVPALYLASSIDGAIAELSHGFGARLQPVTICEYDLDCDAIADLRAQKSSGLSKREYQALSCPWRYQMSEGSDPDSWKLVDQISTDMNGMLVPSFARQAKEDAFNIVLWHWGPKRPSKVEVHDPFGRLPKNQLSWK